VNQILALNHARKSCGSKVVLDDVTLAFLPGASRLRGHEADQPDR
jgi:hypothetical protein